MAGSRTFIALALPDEHRRALHKLAGDRDWPGFSWTPRDQLHVTLRFMSDVGEAQRESLIGALSSVRVAPFFLPLEGIGTFPPRGMPRVIWVGVGRGHPLLYQLRQRLDDTLLSLGLAVDLRTFQPHVTLARLGPGAVPVTAAHFVKRHREFIGPSLHVDRFGLYTSEPTPAGALHTLLHEFPFEGASVAGRRPSHSSEVE